MWECLNSHTDLSVWSRPRCATDEALVASVAELELLAMEFLASRVRRQQRGAGGCDSFLRQMASTRWPQPERERWIERAESVAQGHALTR